LFGGVRIRGLLFDYGGTLDGPASHWLDRFVDLYRELGAALPFAQIKEAFYRADEAAYGAPTILDASLADLMTFHVDVQLRNLPAGSPDLRARLVDRFVARSEAALAESRRVLAHLHGRFRLGVVSNFYGNVGRILDDAGIAPLLTVIVDSQRVGLSKPDPRVYTHAVTALGCAPAETIHVGDSYERDVVAARRAGLRVAWLVGDRTPAIPAGDLAPDLSLRSLDELLPYLDAV
jgi:putative hydrolase of the HAD superfamily